MRGDDAVALRPKTWAVLSLFRGAAGRADHQGRAPGALWPNVAVSEDTLSKSIGELRNALGDEAKAPRFIETVHRRGFRFVARQRDAPSPSTDRRHGAERVARSARPFVGRAEELAAAPERCLRRRASASASSSSSPARPGSARRRWSEAFLDRRN